MLPGEEARQLLWIGLPQRFRTQEVFSSSLRVQTVHHIFCPVFSERLHEETNRDILPPTAINSWAVIIWLYSSSACTVTSSGMWPRVLTS